jgi:hypothetical protein
MRDWTKSSSKSGNIPNASIAFSNFASRSRQVRLTNISAPLISAAILVIDQRGAQENII